MPLSVLTSLSNNQQNIDNHSRELPFRLFVCFLYAWFGFVLIGLYFARKELLQTHFLGLYLFNRILLGLS